MDYSRTFKAAMGVGDNAISVDGAVPPELAGVIGGGTQWLTDNTIIYNRQSGNRHLVEALNIVGERKTIDERGASVIVAGAGFWAVWSAGYGYRDSSAHTSTAWHPLAADDELGRVAVCLDYYTGTGLAVWDGMVLRTIETGRLGSLEACFRRGTLCYQMPGATKLWHASGSRFTLPDLPVSGVQYYGGYRLVWSEAKQGLYVVRELGADGMLVSGDGKDFNARIRTTDDGLIHVVSSSGQAELPHELRRYVINPMLATVNGQPSPWVSLKSTAPPPPPPPTPEPPPMPVEPASLLDALKVARAFYGASMSNDECVALLNKVAWDARALGWGLLLKTSGNHGVRWNGTPCSVDWLVHQPSGLGCDVLSDAGGASNPVWPTMEPFDASRFVEPLQPGEEPIPIPPPTPEPAPPPPTDPFLVEAIGSILADLSKLTIEVQQLRRVVAALGDQVGALEFEAEKEPPTYQGRVFGSTVTLRPVP